MSTRIADIVTGETPRAERFGRLYADPQTVALVRRVARLEHWRISQCLDELLRAYVELRRPTWRIIERAPASAGGKPKKAKKRS